MTERIDTAAFPSIRAGQYRAFSFHLNDQRVNVCDLPQDVLRQTVTPADIDNAAQRLARDYEAKTGDKVVRIYLKEGWPPQIGFLTEKDLATD